MVWKFSGVMAGPPPGGQPVSNTFTSDGLPTLVKISLGCTSSVAVNVPPRSSAQGPRVMVIDPAGWATQVERHTCTFHWVGLPLQFTVIGAELTRERATISMGTLALEPGLGSVTAALRRTMVSVGEMTPAGVVFSGTPCKLTMPVNGSQPAPKKPAGIGLKLKSS